MSEPLVLVTGFGAFPGTERNPSREIARALEDDPPPGVRLRSAELPVTFAGAPPAIDLALEGLAGVPDLLLGLGVQPDPWFRLERRARGRLTGERPDNDGSTAGGLDVDAGPDLETALDLERLARAMRAAGAPDVRLSDDAGGYVCERTYHHLLSCGRALERPALFLHLPPAATLEPADQLPFVRALLAACL
jgi:pyroglutamyl-peptidase